MEEEKSTQKKRVLFMGHTSFGEVEKEKSNTS